MPIHDTDPERRNLMVTSLSFILFYLGEGKINSNEVRIQIVNITFQNKEILAVFAWVMLFWFALRYWQKHKGIFYTAFLNYIPSFAQHKLTIWYLENELKMKYREENGFMIKSMDHRNINFQNIIALAKNRSGEITNIKPEMTAKAFKIRGFRGFIFKVVLFFHIMITKEGFGSVIVPYLLFYLAVLIPIVKLL